MSPRHYITYVDVNTNNSASGVPKIIYNYADTVKGKREEISLRTFQAGTVAGNEYDFYSGMPTSIFDSDSNRIRLIHNDMGRVTSITPAGGLPVTYQYNPLNLVDLEQIIREGLGTKTFAYNTYHQVTQIQDEVGHITGPIAYDGFGRIATIFETFDSQSVLTEYIYYEPGVAGEYRLKEVRKDGQIIAAYTYDPIGRVRTATNAAGITLTYTYNNLNHVTRITYPDAKYIAYSYASCCPRSIDAVTDRAGRTTYYTYDSMQRLISEHQPGVGYINYEYDANGNLIRLIDANGNVTRFEYDDEDRLLRKYDALERFTAYEYNGNGLLEKRTDARGIETTYGYDENHRLISVTHSDTTPAIIVTYDDYQRIDTVSGALGVHDYQFFGNDQLASIDGPWPNDTVSYGYNNLGRIKTITPQGGRARTHAYDNLGRLQDITIAGDTYTYGYQGANPLVRSLNRPNNSRTTYDHDSLNRLEHVTHFDSADQVLSQFDFQYNDQDLIAHETVTNAPAVGGLTDKLVGHDYNALNQLIASTSPERLYTYDEDGNLISGFTPAGHAFTAVYNADERLSSIEYNDGDTVHRYEFVYGFDGFLGQMKRFENTTPVEDLRIVRAGALAVQERDGANAVIREYLWGLNKGGGIGGLLAMGQGGRDYAYLFDGKGNVSAVIDSAQAVVASYRYDSFGRLMTQTGTLDQPFQFSTKRYLADVGLNYYGFRFYSPAMGRWLNRDPLGELGGLNLYGFVQNDPVNIFDPYGLESYWDNVFNDVAAANGGAIPAGVIGIVGSSTTILGTATEGTAAAIFNAASAIIAAYEGGAFLGAMYSNIQHGDGPSLGDFYGEIIWNVFNPPTSNNEIQYYPVPTLAPCP